MKKRASKRLRTTDGVTARAISVQRRQVGRRALLQERPPAAHGRAYADAAWPAAAPPPRRSRAPPPWPGRGAGCAPQSGREALAASLGLHLGPKFGGGGRGEVAAVHPAAGEDPLVGHEVVPARCGSPSGGGALRRRAAPGSGWRRGGGGRRGRRGCEGGPLGSVGVWRRGSSRLPAVGRRVRARGAGGCCGSALRPGGGAAPWDRQGSARSASRTAGRR